MHLATDRASAGSSELNWRARSWRYRASGLAISLSEREPPRSSATVLHAGAQGESGTSGTSPTTRSPAAAPRWRSGAASVYGAGAMEPIRRSCLADDHAVVRAGLRLLLEAEPDLPVVAEAGTSTTPCA